MMCFVDLVPDLVPTWSLKLVLSFYSSRKKPILCASIGDFRKKPTKIRNKRQAFCFYLPLFPDNRLGKASFFTPKKLGKARLGTLNARGYMI